MGLPSIVSLKVSGCWPAVGGCYAKPPSAALQPFFPYGLPLYFLFRKRCRAVGLLSVVATRNHRQQPISPCSPLGFPSVSFSAKGVGLLACCRWLLRETTVSSPPALFPLWASPLFLVTTHSLAKARSGERCRLKAPSYLSACAYRCPDKRVAIATTLQQASWLCYMGFWDCVSLFHNPKIPFHFAMHPASASLTLLH